MSNNTSKSTLTPEQRKKRYQELTKTYPITATGGALGGALTSHGLTGPILADFVNQNALTLSRQGSVPPHIGKGYKTIPFTEYADALLRAGGLKDSIRVQQTEVLPLKGTMGGLYVPNKWFFNSLSCSICSEIDFDSSINNSIFKSEFGFIQKNSFFNFLLNNNLPNKDITYAKYLYDTISKRELYKQGIISFDKSYIILTAVKSGSFFSNKNYLYYLR